MEITWLVNGEEIHDGIRFLPSPLGTSNTSNLTVASPLNVGVYNYTCRVTVKVTGDPIQEAESTARVIITEGGHL